MIDYQAGMFAYLEADDRLTGCNHKQQLLDYQDENGDGVIDYLEGGKNTGSGAAFQYSQTLTDPAIDPQERLKFGFFLSLAPARWIKKEWNKEGLETGERNLLSQSVARAYAMSQAKGERPDPFYPGRVWGSGKWPSMQFVLHLLRFVRIYGFTFPDRIDWQSSPYGRAFAYVDLKWNGSRYCTVEARSKNEDVIASYRQALNRGEKALPFTLYVPEGFGSYNNQPIPNVVETNKPELVFTARFPDNEVWGEFHMSDFPWLKTI